MCRSMKKQHPAILWMLVLGMVACMALGASVARAGATIWQEGEDPDVDNMNRHPWWYDKVKPELLSGGKWISNWSADKVGEAAYDVFIPETNAYEFYVRANPTQSKLHYRVDDGPWTPVDFSGANEPVNVAADEVADLRFVAWVRVGEMQLTKGEHVVRFRMDSDNNNHGALDCFVLTSEGFRPVGTAKPGEASAAPTQAPKVNIPTGDSWPFVFPGDSFKDSALMDLRYLNEAQSGETGFIQLSEGGDNFVKGNGEPIRFWAVCDYAWRKTPEEMDTHCRFMAKLGVNMLRIHANIAPTKEGQKLTDYNEQEIDQIWRFVAAAKKHGIYLTVSPYWYHHKIPLSWGLEGYKTGDMPTGALFFNPKFQEGYKAWVSKLYGEVNPYTGIAMKDDPTIAIIQIKNEDSLLFYTFDRIPEPQIRILGKMYGDWLTKKYGSLQGAEQAWSGAPEPKSREGKAMDDFANGIAGFYITWELTQPQSGGKAIRVRDQLEFVAKAQHDFFADITAFYRDELGCKQLTNAMNWKSADKLTTDDVERWTYTASDVIAVNRYAGGRHIGENNGYRIDPGHYLENRSLLKNPLQIPTNLKQVAGRPMLITESSWVNPNLYQSEGPLLIAAYQSISGIDGFYWFAAGEVFYMEDQRRLFWKMGDSYALQKWTCSMPALQGMYPANALMYRQGYLKDGEVVVREERTMDALWDRKRPIIAETESFDPIRDEKDLRTSDQGNVDVTRLAFLTGKVEVVFDGDPNKTTVTDLSPYIDGANSTVKSTTGEVELKYDVGLLKVNAPKAQAVGGFLQEAGGRFELADVTIESTNDYATIQLVSMDGKPLSESEKVLVQVGTVNRLTGWTTKPDSIEQGGERIAVERIVNTGKPPYQIKNTLAKLTVRNPNLTKATLLDVAGYPRADVPVEVAGGQLVIDLPKDTMYLVLSSR